MAKINDTSKVTAKQTVIPFWSEHKRGVPNVLARSALFGIGDNKKKRNMLEAAPIATYGDSGCITYTGLELRQDDADLFLQLIHLQRERDFSVGVEFKTTPMLKTLGRSQNSNYTERMKRSLQRMVATAITIETKDAEGNGVGYCGSLIARFAWKDDNGAPSRTWRVWFDPKIAQLFDWASYSQLDWKVRLSLSPLAKWMHLYYCSHKNPYPIKCENLLIFCGSSMTQLKHFRQELFDASNELKEVGFLSEWRIDKQQDTLHVVKNNQKQSPAPQ
ncbi:MAG: hypothetical protein CTY35_00565 [Methylotenera sp.]|uniref:plasmid replication initiator TrfA n=1 Tax=Methylotenera sp. TaxID=2051956 RepID=UPI000D4A5AD0|nr:plasmid replication initiator TrfA [Methylotenera sp.]PPC84848.1 MAG: hypothetical protein CTY38_00560 [Methylotenera sp.]PPD02208.1 MAG: hypothetical protein CTY35_00565 [Methylotenera sp.]